MLTAFGTVSATAMAGCSSIVSPGGPEGEGDTIEILVENDTDTSREIAVRIAGGDGQTLFSRVYRLEPQHLDQSAGIETRPAKVTAFTPDGASATWTYSPERDLDCDGVDVGISLRPGRTFEEWYSC